MAKNETTETFEDAVEYVSAEETEATDAGSALDVLGASETGIKAEIRDLVNGAPALYSSIKGTDFKARKEVVEKLTNSVPVSEHIGTVINLKHVLVQTVTMVNKVTNRVEDQPRVILIDDNGTAYHGISKGLFLSVRNIIGIMGEPDTWTETLPVVVKREKASIGHFFTMEIAG